MRYFRLKAGAHVQAKHDWSPPSLEEFRKLHPDLPYPPSAPDQSFRVGDVVPFDGDLVERHGAAKWDEIPEDQVHRKHKVVGQKTVEQKSAAPVPVVPPGTTSNNTPGDSASVTDVNRAHLVGGSGSGDRSAPPPDAGEVSGPNPHPQNARVAEDGQGQGKTVSHPPPGAGPTQPPAEPTRADHGKAGPAQQTKADAVPSKTTHGTGKK